MISSLTHPSLGEAVTALGKSAADRYGSAAFIAKTSPLESETDRPLSSTKPSPAATSSAPVSMAQSSSATLGTGTGPVKSGSIDAASLTGTWHARTTNGLAKTHHLLVVQPTREWELSSVTLHEGLLDAHTGLWTMDRSMTLQGHTWHGTYQTIRDENFSTTGSLNARWKRIPEGENPTHIPAELWHIRRAAKRAPVFQLQSVDPELVGLWEGTGTYHGGTASFVWSIMPSAATDLLILETTHGTLGAKDGTLQLLPAKSLRRSMTIVAFHSDSFTTSDGKVTIRWNHTPPQPSPERDL
jgi:hypothetical protein